ncbi:carcinine hydrolase/isopenicillin-N N-acyltransferase family protein [Gracilibacillus alcaliphilus]|uniref:carcinine hydrolase/isopenicillin-N N-acyltransferase family protein n=1 Tax=Gracilibacillus alcaliphilus TaxID=1401441 RepID=UPI0019574EAA|nr:carcinine hydrolase/isopenicillin-N N-acyltransferase family protein [Gracilibacillus alcaliphilus]MBM7677515.1 hypothetical protein [Gracilibacillus alcaliphilus]
MCTMLMKQHMENKLLFAAKTVDTPETSLIFDYKPSSLEHYGYFFFKMGWQNGVNSGMNGEGLAVLSSYASLTEHLPSEVLDKEDTRGMANEQVLRQCTNVQDGLHLLEGILMRKPSEVGGIHFLIDASYSIGVLEHDPVTRAIKKHRLDTNYVIRANHPLFFKERDKEGADRRLRYDQVAKAIDHIQGENWLVTLQSLLGQHVSDDDKQTGSICIHHFDNKGTRSKDESFHSTETALIFDVVNKRCIYSDGSPCKGKWTVWSMNKRGVE